MSRSKILIFLVVLSETLLVVLLPYVLVMGRQPVPFRFYVLSILIRQTFQDMVLYKDNSC